MPRSKRCKILAAVLYAPGVKVGSGLNRSVEVRTVVNRNETALVALILAI